ncbi:unnamed protein product [Arctogadus glacialis]
MRRSFQTSVDVFFSFLVSLGIIFLLYFLVLINVFFHIVVADILRSFETKGEREREGAPERGRERERKREREGAPERERERERERKRQLERNNRSQSKRVSEIEKGREREGERECGSGCLGNKP